MDKVAVVEVVVVKEGGELWHRVAFLGLVGQQRGRIMEKQTNKVDGLTVT